MTTIRKLTLPFKRYDQLALKAAIERIVANGGRAGIDGLDPREAFGEDAAAQWRATHHMGKRLKDGSLCPRPAIGPQRRPVVAACDRVITRYLATTAFSTIEAKLPPQVVGHRTSGAGTTRSPLLITDWLLRRASESRSLYVLKVDVQDCFVSVSPEPLLAEAELQGVQACAVSWARDFYRIQKHPGLIAGQALAPLLFHLRMAKIDLAMIEQTKGEYRRYGDDLVMVFDAETAATRALSILRELLAPDLALNTGKQYLGPIAGQFQVLGLAFNDGSAFPGRESTQRLLDRLEHIRRTEPNPEVALDRLEGTANGWFEHHRQVAPSAAYEALAKVREAVPELGDFVFCASRGRALPARPIILPDGDGGFRVLGEMEMLPPQGADSTATNHSTCDAHVVRHSSPGTVAVSTRLPPSRSLGNIVIEALRRGAPHPRLCGSEWQERMFVSTPEFLDAAQVLTDVLTGLRGEERFDWICQNIFRASRTRVFRAVRVAHLIATAADSDGDELSAFPQIHDIETWVAPETDCFPISVTKAMVELRSEKPWAWHLRGTIVALIVRGELSSTQAIHALKHSKLRARRSAVIPKDQRSSPRWSIRLRNGSRYRGLPHREISVEVEPGHLLTASDMA